MLKDNFQYLTKSYIFIVSEDFLEGDEYEEEEEFVDEDEGEMVSISIS
jgi:hypothetical protein